MTQLVKRKRTPRPLGPSKIRVNVSISDGLYRLLADEAERNSVAPGTMARMVLNDRYKKTNGDN